jgi:CRISPR-associated protein Cas5d
MTSDYRRGKTHVLEVWGEFACFTRPEAKAERYSYPIITPSAARGVFDAIYFKRGYGFFWQIEAVELLALPRYVALRRNEVKNKAPYDGDRELSVHDLPGYFKPIYADATEEDNKGRTQRQTMALKNVRYRLHAHMCLRRGGSGDLREMDAQFERRASHGKCFYQPYLGCREFPAWFSTEVSDCSPVSLDMPLGWMVYDVFDLSRENDMKAEASISVFNATISNGRMSVPPYFSNAVKRVEVTNAK